jgi:hypothetical protein
MSALPRLALALLAATAACDSGPHGRAQPWPEVPTQSGGMLAPLRLVTIVPQNDAPDASAFFAFSTTLARSTWWAQLSSEYDLGTVDGATTLTGPVIAGPQITDHEIFAYIDAMIAPRPDLTPDGKTLYLLYLPSGVTVVARGTANADCQTFGAYHDVFGARGDNYAVVQRCTEDFAVENMTISASHEIAEAATDPRGDGFRLPQIAVRQPWTETIWNAWNRTGRAELADLCEGTFWVENQRVYQRVWSNAAARRGGDPCIPALKEPYYGVEFQKEWYAVPAGERIDIPLEGWATGGITAWPLGVFVGNGDVDFSATFAAASPNVSPGTSATLLVEAPADAPSGSFAVIGVQSKRPPHAPSERGLTDGVHLDWVGVYVP